MRTPLDEQKLAALGRLVDAMEDLGELFPSNEDLLIVGYPTTWHCFDDMTMEAVSWFALVRDAVDEKGRDGDV